MFVPNVSLLHGLSEILKTELYFPKFYSMRGRVSACERRKGASSFISVTCRFFMLYDVLKYRTAQFSCIKVK